MRNIVKIKLILAQNIRINFCAFDIEIKGKLFILD